MGTINQVKMRSISHVQFRSFLEWLIPFFQDNIIEDDDGAFIWLSLLSKPFNTKQIDAIDAKEQQMKSTRPERVDAFDPYFEKLINIEDPFVFSTICQSSDTLLDFIDKQEACFYISCFHADP